MVTPAAPSVRPAGTTRVRRDLCPAVSRPWPATDGLLVRLRLVGGLLPARALGSLAEAADRFGDGAVHLTGRANLQVRGLPAGREGGLAPAADRALRATGLVPHPAHELARNVLVSPLSGLVGGRADLRPVAAALDAAIVADHALAALPGRFLHVLDDGRGDVLPRGGDLSLVALDDVRCQVRAGSTWGPVVPLDRAAEVLVALARAFLESRGDGPTAPWHVDELPGGGAALVTPSAPDPRAEVASPPLPFGPVRARGTGAVVVDHVEAPDGLLDAAAVGGLVSRGDVLVVTPWRGVLAPPGPAHPAARSTEEDR
ncbi:nitrite reductase [Nocardioides bruguierae]|uniref:nitrite reductase n=1 Tax=Nocardioides bruguierae TaxID=2945102 RepID=UPI002020735B|nr:nitrite reductase [Nocardioides bruguierae]MCL8026946.1 nitrite reductase [Nocardioides bruguierae]